jgi:Zn-dependent protease with chaperone function
MGPHGAACLLAVVIATHGAATNGASLRTWMQAPGTLRPAAAPQPPLTYVVTDEMRAHQRWIDGLYFAENAYQIGILAALLALGAGARLRRLVSRLTARPFPLAMVTFALFAAILAGLSLPLIWISTFWVPHRFGLSDQSLGRWAADEGKAALIGLAVAAPVAALALAGMRRLKRWWLWLWLASVPLSIALQVVVPVAFDPLFNRFEPVRDEQLRRDLLDLASRAGIDGGRVYEVDKSQQTNTLNAYVNGLGPTKRIVLWDTIIEAMDRDELEFVMAHEMGHYVLNHIWRLLGFGLAVLLVALWAGQRVVERATARWGAGWGFTSPGDPASLPLLALVLSAFVFLSMPVLSAYSRRLEHQADIFAIELTRLNDAGARAFVTLAERAKLPPDPNPFVQFWSATHPSFAARLDECRLYKPWERGEANRAWRPRD